MEHALGSQTTAHSTNDKDVATATTSSALGETPGGAGLSMNAREWRPGTSYFGAGNSNSSANTSTTSTVSSSSSSSSSSSWPNQHSFHSPYGTSTTAASKSQRHSWYNASTSASGGGGDGEGATRTATAAGASGNLPMNEWTGIAHQATSNMAWGGGGVGSGAADTEESDNDGRKMAANNAAGRTMTTSALPEARIWARAARHRGGNGTTVLSSPGGIAPLPRTAASLGVGGGGGGGEGWGAGEAPADRFWRRYRDITADTAQQMDPEDPRHRAVPASFFCDAYPLCDADDGSDAGAAVAAGASSSSASSTAEFGYPVSTFRVTGREDGRLYCLRRFDNCKAVSAQIARSVVMRWMSACDARTGRAVVAHPGLVRLRDAFVLNRAVFFVHDYHPMTTATTGGGGGGYRTLRQLMRDAAAAAETHRRGSTGGSPSSSATTAPPMPEPMIWSILVQLTSALRTVHAANLACRTLRLHRILCCPRGGAEGGPGGAAEGGARSMRVRINCVGIVDALEFESRHDMTTLQRQDLYALGRVLLSLMTGTDVDATLLGDAAKTTSTATPATTDSPVGSQSNNSRDDHTIVEEYWVRWSAYLPAIYSEDLCMVLSHLLSRPKTAAASSPTSENDGIGTTLSCPSIETLSSLVAPRAFDDLDASHLSYDVADDMLASTYECGRGLRLLMKLGYVNERPEFGVDRRWSETGDCYVLKLFRDYVFHQADAAGRPVMDVGHVVQSLNKLDAADEEKIVLVSRDGTTMMVVSFADVARCLEGAYEDLCRGGTVSSFSEMGSSTTGSSNNVGMPGGGGGGMMAGGLFIPPTQPTVDMSPSSGNNTTNNNGTTWPAGGGGYAGGAPHSPPSPYQSPYPEYYHR